MSLDSLVCLGTHNEATTYPCGLQRYDLDESGTINSREEFRMLTTNLIFKMQLSVSPDKLEAVLETVDYDREYGIPQYTSWFMDAAGVMVD